MDTLTDITLSPHTITILISIGIFILLLIIIFLLYRSYYSSHTNKPYTHLNNTSKIHPKINVLKELSINNNIIDPTLSTANNEINVKNKDINQQPINQPINQQPINQPIDQQPINQPIDQPVIAHIDRPADPIIIQDSINDLNTCENTSKINKTINIKNTQDFRAISDLPKTKRNKKQEKVFSSIVEEDNKPLRN